MSHLFNQYKNQSTTSIPCSSHVHIPGEMSWKSNFHIVYCKGPMYLDVGKSSYVRLVSCIFPLILKKQTQKSKSKLLFPSECQCFQVFILVCVFEILLTFNGWHQRQQRWTHQWTGYWRGGSSASTSLQYYSIWTSTWITPCIPSCSKEFRQDSESVKKNYTFAQEHQVICCVLSESQNVSWGVQYQYHFRMVEFF